MSDEATLQRVRFTGKRTGLESIMVNGIGRIAVGDTVEVTEEEAERFTFEHATRDGGTAADFVKVGGTFKVPRKEVSSRRAAQLDKLHKDEDAEDFLSSTVNTDPAHPTMADTGTVEEYAEVVTTPVPAEADEPSKGKSKKA